MEAYLATYGPRFTNTMLNPVEPALSFFTPEQLSWFMRENIDDPIAQKIADFIIVTRMAGRDFVRMTRENLEVLSEGLPAITEVLTSFQAQTMIPSPTRRYQQLDDIFSELSTTSSASSDKQVTSDMESNYWLSAPSRSPSPDRSLSSADDDSYHDASSQSIHTSSPLPSPPSSPPHPLQVMTDFSVDLEVTVLDFAFSTLDDDELRSLYPRSTTHFMTVVYQEPGLNETDAPLPNFLANDTTSPPTLASITPEASWDAWDLWNDTGSIVVSKYPDFEINPSAGMSSSSLQRVANSEVSYPSYVSSDALQLNDSLPDISQMDEIEGSEPEWSDNISNADLHTSNEDVSPVAIDNDMTNFSELPLLDLGDASPQTVTIHDRIEPSSPSLYNLHDVLPPLAGPFSGAPGFDSQRNSPVTPYRVEIIGARRWDVASKPPSLPILSPTSPEGSWGPDGGSAVSIPTDPIASQSLCSTTSTAARSFFALQVPQEWPSKDSDEIDMKPKPPGFRANFSDRTALLSPIHGQSDDEIDDEDVVTLDLGGDSTSPSLPLGVLTYSLLDDDEISPLLFSPPSVPTRSNINPAASETPHDLKLSLDTSDRTLWPSGSVAYRRRTLSSPTIVRRVPKIPMFDNGMVVTGPHAGVASINVANQLPEFSSTGSGTDRKTFLEYPSATGRNGWGKRLRNWLRSIGTPPVQSPLLKRTRSLLSPRAKIEVTDSRLLPIIRGPLSATEPTPDITPATFA